MSRNLSLKAAIAVGTYFFREKLRSQNILRKQYFAIEIASFSYSMPRYDFCQTRQKYLITVSRAISNKPRETQQLLLRFRTSQFEWWKRFATELSIIKEFQFSFYVLLLLLNFTNMCQKCPKTEILTVPPCWEIPKNTPHVPVNTYPETSTLVALFDLSYLLECFEPQLNIKCKNSTIVYRAYNHTRIRVRNGNQEFSEITSNFQLEFSNRNPIERIEIPCRSQEEIYSDFVPWLGSHNF